MIPRRRSPAHRVTHARNPRPCWTLLGLPAYLVLAGSGCGGNPSDSFANSIYVSITAADKVDPASVGLANGARIVFLNKDGVAHAVNWNSPLVLSASAPAGGRAWFDLPYFYPGTVLSYHLDQAGATGSVTIVGP